METIKQIAVHTFSAVLAFVIVFVLFSFWVGRKAQQPAGGCGCGGKCGGDKEIKLPPIIENPLPPIGDNVQIQNGLQQLVPDYFANTTWAAAKVS